MSRRYSVQCNNVEIASFDDPALAKAYEAKESLVPATHPVRGKRALGKWAVIDTQTHTPVP